MGVSSFIRSVRNSISAKYQSEKTRVSQARESGERNKLPQAIRKVTSVPSTPTTPSSKKITIFKRGGSNLSSSSGSSISKDSDSSSGEMIDRELVVPRGVDSLRPINDPNDVSHRTNINILETQQLQKDSSSYNTKVEAFNLKYGTGELTESQYAQAQSEAVALGWEQRNLIKEQTRLNADYNLISTYKDDSYYGRSLARQNRDTSIIDKGFSFIGSSRVGSFDMGNVISGGRTGEAIRDLLYLGATTTAQTPAFLRGELERGFLDPSQPIINYNKGFMTSGSLFKEPFTVNRNNREVKERPIEFATALLVGYQVAKTGYGLARNLKGYMEEPLGYKYVTTSVTESGASGYMLVTPRYKGWYNKLVGGFDDVDNLVGGGGSSNLFKADPDVYTFRANTLPSPMGTPENIRFNIGQVSQLNKLKAGSFTQRITAEEYFYREQLNTGLSIKGFSKRGYSNTYIEGAYNNELNRIFVNFYNKPTKTGFNKILTHELFHYQYAMKGNRYINFNPSIIKALPKNNIFRQKVDYLFDLGYKKGKIAEEYFVRNKTYKYFANEKYAPFGKLKIPTTNLGKIGDSNVISGFTTVSKTTPDVLIFKENINSFVTRDVDVGIGLGVNRAGIKTPYAFSAETQRNFLQSTEGTIYTSRRKIPFQGITLVNAESGTGGSLLPKSSSLFNNLQQVNTLPKTGNIKMNIIYGVQDMQLTKLNTVTNLKTVNQVGVLNRVGFVNTEDVTRLRVNVLNSVGNINKVGVINRVVTLNQVGNLNRIRVGNLERIGLLERTALKSATLQQFRTTQLTKPYTPLAPPINIPFPVEFPPFIPPFFSMGADMGGLTNRKIKAKRITRYTPSYTALIFGIKGRKPRGVETGARIRPITKGFSWFKL
jgi:hypothetical protein